MNTTWNDIQNANGEALDVIGEMLKRPRLRIRSPMLYLGEDIETDEEYRARLAERVLGK